jgi:hypothetical protein
MRDYKSVVELEHPRSLFICIWNKKRRKPRGKNVTHPETIFLFLCLPSSSLVFEENIVIINRA